MPHDVDISVVIPTYNCADFLPRALESVQNQRMDSIEVIVVNDGSTDHTASVLDSWQSRFSHFRVIESQNVGVNAARNLAIASCKGEYVAFLDADDFWYDGKLKKQFQFCIDNEDVVLTCTNYDHLTESLEYIIDCYAYMQRAVLDNRIHDYKVLPKAPAYLLGYNLVGTSTVMAKTQALQNVGGFNTELKSASDWDLWLRLSTQGKVAHCGRPYAGYLVRQGSISSNRKLRIDCMREIIDTYAALPEFNQKWAVKAAHAHINEGYGDFYRQMSAPAKALKHDIQSMLLEPSIRRLKHICKDYKMMFRKRWA